MRNSLLAEMRLADWEQTTRTALSASSAGKIRPRPKKLSDFWHRGSRYRTSFVGSR